MSQTKAGAKIAAQKIKERYGADYYKIQGAKGGLAKVPKGFAINRELAKTVGSKGGKISSRKGVPNGR